MTEQDTTTTQPAADVHTYIRGRCGACGVARRDEHLYGPSPCVSAGRHAGPPSTVTTIFDVAEYIVAQFERPISTMKLQKLLYLAQGWNLALTGKPLFREDFEAWASGPVCRTLQEVHAGAYTIGPDDLNVRLIELAAQERRDALAART